MLSSRRILDAVTFRRVVVVLLLGGFAEAIASFLGWLVSVGWELKDVATLRAFLAAAIVFAVDAGLIYLALRGLGSLLQRWRREKLAAIVAEPTGERDAPVPLKGIDGVGIERADWLPEGGGNGRGSEYC